MGYTPHVLVTGIDPVGAGIARDFAIRGLDVTLIDARPLDSPRVGRLDGLLASGAQFARQDPQYARRCLQENRTLFEIANHCIEDTGGLVVDEDLDTLRDACRGCGIAPQKLSGREARDREPALSESVSGALSVPDATIDPYLLTVALVRDARNYGAEIRPHTDIRDIHVEDGAVESVTVGYEPAWDSLEALPPDTGDEDDTGGDEEATDADTPGGEDTTDKDTTDEDATDEDTTASDTKKDADGDHENDQNMRADGGATAIPGLRSDEQSGQPGASKTNQIPEAEYEELAVDYVINAAGPDARAIVTHAGGSLPVSYERVPVAVADIPVQCALTTPRGLTADSVAPVGGRVLLEASTRDESPTDKHNQHTEPASEAVDDIVSALSELVGVLDGSDLLRAETMIRYELEPGRGRDFAVVDHASQDCWGLLTVLGGTVTTHRWVAEKICDRVCEEFGILRECKTDELVLPGSENTPDLAEAVGTSGLAPDVYERSKRRLGSAAGAVLHTEAENPVLCECQSVTRAEVEAALVDETAAPADLAGVRTRTAATTGSCQGGRCAHRLATQLHPDYDTTVVDAASRTLLDERWCGQRPVADRLDEMASTYRLQVGVMGRRDDDPESPELTAFEDGITSTAERPTCCPRPGGWE